MMLVAIFIVNIYLIYKIYSFQKEFGLMLKQMRFLSLDIVDIKNYLEELNDKIENN